MIRVNSKPEPANFDELVRQPGNKILQNVAAGGTNKLKNLWKKVSKELHVAYDGICAYTCMYVIPPASVDHFLPQSTHQHLAYEWSNYRLATQRVNQHKGNSLDVIDPFNIQEGWFALDFPSCLVVVGETASEAVAREVQLTISTLKLNDDDTFVQERCDMMMAYAEGEVELGFLQRRYPFLAQEIIRQGIENTVGDIFKRRKQ